MTGHKDIKLADHYSKCDEEDQKEESLKIMDFIKKQQSSELTSQDSNSNVIAFLMKKLSQKIRISWHELAFANSCRLFATILIT